LKVALASKAAAAPTAHSITRWQKLPMKCAAKAKATPGQIAFYLQALKQPNKRIDYEAAEAILCTHKWYLESGRTDRFITQTLHRMSTVDAVIRDPKQWAFSLEKPIRLRKYGNSIHHE